MIGICDEVLLLLSLHMASRFTDPKASARGPKWPILAWIEERLAKEKKAQQTSSCQRFSVNRNCLISKELLLSIPRCIYVLESLFLYSIADASFCISSSGLLLNHFAIRHRIEVHMRRARSVGTSSKAHPRGHTASNPPRSMNNPAKGVLCRTTWRVMIACVSIF